MARGTYRYRSLVAIAVISMAVAMVLSMSVNGSAVLGVTTQPLAEEPTCKIYGWVNDSVTLQGIDNATIIMIGEEFINYTETMTNEIGYYETDFVRGETILLFSAPGHYSVFLIVDTASLTELRQDAYLDPEPTVPTALLTLNHYENISSHRPLVAHAISEDFNIMGVEAVIGHVWTLSGDRLEFTLIDLDLVMPLYGIGSDSFVYTYEDDLFIGDYTWPATTPSAGYLINETVSEYVQLGYHRTINEDESYGIAGRYWNDSLDEESGFAFFDNATGEYLGFEFVNTTDPFGTLDPPEIPAASPDDPSGVFAPSATVYSGTVVENDYGDTFEWSDSQFEELVLEPRSVSGLAFEYTNDVPSGDYVALLMVIDEANNLNMTTEFFTVDASPPTADAGEDQDAVVGVEVSLSGAASEDDIGITDYSWTFEEDGEPVSLYGETVVHAFSEPGAYTVTLVVRDGGLNEDSDTVLITVEEDAPPVAEAGSDSLTVPEDSLVTFDGSGSHDDVGITEYSWEITELGVQYEGVEFNYTFETLGTYHVNLTVTDSIGQVSDPDTITVTVTDATAPVADAGDDIGTEAGDTVQLDGSGSSDNVGIVNYTWTFEYDGGTVILYGESPEFTFDEPGTYEITLTVTDGEGLEGTDAVTVTVTDGAGTLDYGLVLGVVLVAALAGVVVIFLLRRNGKAT